MGRKPASDARGPRLWQEQLVVSAAVTRKLGRPSRRARHCLASLRRQKQRPRSGPSRLAGARPGWCREAAVSLWTLPPSLAVWAAVCLAAMRL